VLLIENYNDLLDSTIRISFETPSAIVPLRYVVRLAAKLISLISLPSLSIKDGFGSSKEQEGLELDETSTLALCNFFFLHFPLCISN
jgi:hypothetical protein